MQSKNDVDELLNNYESKTNQYKEAENRNKCFLEYCNKQIGDSITRNRAPSYFRKLYRSYLSRFSS